MAEVQLAIDLHDLVTSLRNLQPDDVAEGFSRITQRIRECLAAAQKLNRDAVGRQKTLIELSKEAHSRSQALQAELAKFGQPTKQALEDKIAALQAEIEEQAATRAREIQATTTRHASQLVVLHQAIDHSEVAQSRADAHSKRADARASLVEARLEAERKEFERQLSAERERRITAEKEVELLRAQQSASKDAAEAVSSTIVQEFVDRFGPKGTRRSGFHDHY
ncbi:unnamed protein product [Zymoseptoria tritici ST99CH_3D7]|uniref:Uncharacterized protein n=1 Tax=Zymoseptoria tritici (strain ST99CH_3D7) TaxID=1276538 RepID=A0A1X7S5Z5_ZYMT9|nr:unnamed protein product [Zymoseptoria tritici ST99CH_3D7]